jgi:tryptophanyl-tRNA synthetase
MNMAYLFSRRATFATLKALYGERSFSLYFAALTQVGDILLPQHKDFGGPKRVVVPVGVDQDPHIRFARDIAAKEKLIPPSATYHRLMRSLKGEAKMSKRDPSSTLSLSDPPEVAEKKLMNAFSGGRNTAEEQRRLGGEIEKDMLYEVMRFHFIEDEKKLDEMREDMESGRLLTGEYKRKWIPVAIEWLKAHQEKKKRMLPKARKILESLD